MRLLLIGPPGAGKGTQAVRVAQRFDVRHISSGDVLRRHVADGTAIGRKIQAYLSSGDLVPDGIVMDVLRKPVVEASRAGGYVLDGFPRTVDQARTAYLVARDLGVAVQVAVHLEVPREELLRRLLARGAEEGRSDDTAEVIEHRLGVYDSKTRPMLAYYAQREKLVGVNGARPVDEVTWSIVVQLQQIRRQISG